MAAGGGGGAWKVAYADFVTAMMALFMVLWISAQDKKILIATSRYFQNPFNSPLEEKSGIMPFNKDTTSSSSSKKEDESAGKDGQTNDKQVQLSFLNSVAADFYRLLQLDQNWEDKPIDIQVTSDGLRITVFDRAKHPLFVGKTAEFTEWGRFLVQNLSWMIERHHFFVTIDGHTRAELGLEGDYGPWELSSDRANAARRALVFYAVDGGQIERVTGYADTMPLDGQPTTSESNQRVTISLRLSAKSREKNVAKIPNLQVPQRLPDKGATPPGAAPAPGTASGAPGFSSGASPTPVRSR
jgi:chemotaxis protein MotB